MNKDNLIQSANKLKEVSEKVSIEYQSKNDNLILCMNNEMLKRNDIQSLIGETNIEMMKDNHANHVRFINTIIKNFNADVLVETVLWVFRAYRSHGFKTNYWSVQLNTWDTLLKKELSEESYNEIYPFYEWMLINIPLFVKLSDEKLDQSNSMH